MADIIITEKNILEFKGDFNSPEILNQIATIEQDFVQSGSVGDSYSFSNNLKAVLKNQQLQPDIQKKYEEMILLLEITAFPLLESEEQTHLLSTSFRFVLKQDMDLKNRIHLVFFPYFNDTQPQKLSRLLRAMQNNGEPLGGKTIGKWIEDYNNSKP